MSLNGKRFDDATGSMLKQPRLWRQRSFCCTDWSGGHAVQSSALRLVSTAIIVAGLYYDRDVIVTWLL
jgi:hypothetical protein